MEKLPKHGRPWTNCLQKCVSHIIGVSKFTYSYEEKCYFHIKRQKIVTKIHPTIFFVLCENNIFLRKNMYISRPQIYGKNIFAIWAVHLSASGMSVYAISFWEHVRWMTMCWWDYLKYITFCSHFADVRGNCARWLFWSDWVPLKKFITQKL